MSSRHDFPHPVRATIRSRASKSNHSRTFARRSVRGAEGVPEHGGGQPEPLPPAGSGAGVGRGAAHGPFPVLRADLLQRGEAAVPLEAGVPAAAHHPPQHHQPHHEQRGRGGGGLPQRDRPGDGERELGGGGGGAVDVEQPSPGPPLAPPVNSGRRCSCGHRHPIPVTRAAMTAPATSDTGGPEQRGEHGEGGAQVLPAGADGGHALVEQRRGRSRQTRPDAGDVGVVAVSDGGDPDDRIRCRGLRACSRLR